MKTMTQVLDKFSEPDIRILHDSDGYILEVAGTSYAGRLWIMDNTGLIRDADTIDDLNIPGLWIEYVEN